MDRERDGDAPDMKPQAEEAPAADAMEQAQKDAAQERLGGGGYGG